jgi:hypothetical protein
VPRSPVSPTAAAADASWPSSSSSRRTWAAQRERPRQSAATQTRAHVCLRAALRTHRADDSALKQVAVLQQL